MAVSFAEMPDSPQESWDSDGLKATVRLMCAWGERNLLIIEKLSGAGELYPRLPGSKARARSASAVPAPGKLTEDAPGYAEYESAIVTVEYNVKGPSEDEELYTESIEPTAEFFTLPVDEFLWGGAGGDPVQENAEPGFLIPGCDFKLSFPNLAAVPAAMFSLAGHVNAAPFTSRTGVSLAAETLLFNPPVISRVVNVEGAEGFKVDLRLTYRPTGWNKYWRPSEQAWQYFYSTVTASIYRSYPLGDFSVLF